MVVYKEEGVNKGYSLESRSYQFRSDSKYFLPKMGGNSIFARNLDNTDSIRVDWYFGDWEIDYCYVMESEVHNMETLYDVVFGYYDGDELIEEFDTYLAAKLFLDEMQKDDYDFIVLRRIEIDETIVKISTSSKTYKDRNGAIRSFILAV